jgi:hypothetical protein
MVSCYVKPEYLLLDTAPEAIIDSKQESLQVSVILHNIPCLSGGIAQCSPSARTSYHEKEVDEDVKIERGELVARVAVVPQEDLHWYNHCGVEEQPAAGEEHPCNAKSIQRG